MTIVARRKNAVLTYHDGVLRVYRGYNSSDLGTLVTGTYRPGARMNLNVELFIYNVTIIVDTRFAKPRYNITALKTLFLE
jgi:hypothetical protein